MWPVVHARDTRRIFAHEALMRGRERGGGALVSPGRMFVRKLLEVARQLGIQTVAEGIETPEELRWVRAPGVDFVQGYLSSRPRAAPATRFFTG